MSPSRVASFVSLSLYCLVLLIAYQENTMDTYGLAIPVLVFNFPVSIPLARLDFELVSLACGVMDCNKSHILNSSAHGVLGWLIYGIAGYLQWFVLLPWAFGKLVGEED